LIRLFSGRDAPAAARGQRFLRRSHLTGPSVPLRCGSSGVSSLTTGPFGPASYVVEQAQQLLERR